MKKAIFFITLCTCCFFLFQYQSRAETKTCFTPGSCCEENILKMIRHSNRQILVAVEDITSTRIFKELLDAFHRGVQLYIITNRKKFLKNTSLVYALNKEGVGVRMSSTLEEKNRFATFDNDQLITGSYSWTAEEPTLTSSSCLLITEGRVVSAHEEHFKQLWNFYTDEIYDFYVQKNYRKDNRFSKFNKKTTQKPRTKHASAMPHPKTHFHQ